ncbi:hypothetical protein An17g01823 [Aspergillus niger]|uniref:Uncharacterized protein n=2 Tax=Aspergillus niger TaxID=5061 RepID=A2R9L1_ASPNC|nr:hypothetical protein An17g01823 [Aspergillus niger]CAK49138.1 hypothetical protein An17g01823 [Aspergillus niger]
MFPSSPLWPCSLPGLMGGGGGGGGVEDRCRLEEDGVVYSVMLPSPMLGSSSLLRFRWPCKSSVMVVGVSPSCAVTRSSSSSDIFMSGPSSSTTSAAASFGFESGSFDCRSAFRCSYARCLATALSKNSLQNFFTFFCCLSSILVGSPTRLFLKSELTNFLATCVDSN